MKASPSILSNSRIYPFTVSTLPFVCLFSKPPLLIQNFHFIIIFVFFFLSLLLQKFSDIFIANRQTSIHRLLVQWVQSIITHRSINLAFHSNSPKNFFPCLKFEQKNQRKKKTEEGFFFPCLKFEQKPSFSLLEMDRGFQIIPFLSLILLLNVSGVFPATFTLINKCSYTVWPGLLSGAGTSQLDTTGFTLPKDESRTISLPTSWSGRLWGRTLCSEDSTGKFTCISGDCGSGKIDCAGGGATPPATLAEFTLNGADGLDFYDVSLVDGYNLPMLVVAVGGISGNCSNTGCVVDLNGVCPTDLKVLDSDGEHVGCKSACEAFGEPRFCCSGEYGSPNTCQPSSYSEFFKNACPRAYSYAYDDGTSTFTCAAANYVITFCPPISTSKKAGESLNGADLPLYNTTMLIMNGEEVSSASSTTKRVSDMQFWLGVLFSVVWRLWNI